MKKSYKAILFDLDGTLVPMNTDEFTVGYFQDLGKKVDCFGYSMEDFQKIIWSGVKAMVLNDGSRQNRDAFWAKFSELTGITDEAKLREMDAMCLDFYGNEFKMAKRFVGDNPLAKEAVSLARTKAATVVLASNPLFPMVGHGTRLGYVGLSLDDFDMATSYETDTFCKPNPQYFTALCDRIGVAPSECLMIGNDEMEDGYAASKAGLDVYICTDSIIPSKEKPWQGEKGTFADMLKMLEGLLPTA